jgi:hypothetical protein
MKPGCTLLLACLYLNIGYTQTSADSVKQTIINLFVAMKNSDRNLLQSVFADSAILQTIGYQKSSGIMVRNQQVNAFIDQVSRLPVNAADERITFDMVKVDADLASVWTPYQFYYRGEFSHCGVNSFQLVRIKGAWKIQYLIDTRRKDKCIE